MELCHDQRQQVLMGAVGGEHHDPTSNTNLKKMQSSAIAFHHKAGSVVYAHAHTATYQLQSESSVCCMFVVQVSSFAMSLCVWRHLDQFQK